MLSLDKIKQMTAEYGEGWGLAHVQRVLRLIALIGVDTPHDGEVLTWATYLHDWGAFPRYFQAGVPHALRSRQVAETEILPQTHFMPVQQVILLETIEKHDYQDERPLNSSEALLLREADYLDMLGAVGIAREFAWGPNQLQTCYDRIVIHREKIQGRFTLPIAQQIAARRIEQMNIILAQIADDSFGYL